MKMKKDRAGFTLAELLITIAILMILFGIGFVAVSAYYRNLRFNEVESIAKELYIASQNQLSKAKENGVLDKYNETYKSDSTHYLIYNRENDYTADGNYKAEKNNYLREEMLLPFGSIDGTVRESGTYIIEFDPVSGTVIQVFYSDSGRYGYKKFTSFSDGIKNLAGNEKKESRKNYNGCVIGWYGGDVSDISYVNIDNDPILEVFNGNVLYAKVKDGSLDAGKDLKVMLCVKGLESTATKTFTVTGKKDTILNNDFILDDITREKMHFSDIRADSEVFIPGEDIELFLTVMADRSFSNVKESNHVITNSLFDSIVKEADNTVTAHISNCRHLENLGSAVSKIDYASRNLKKAEQVADLDWSEFLEETNKSVYANNSDFGDNSNFGDNNYYPINLSTAFMYEGNDRIINGITITINTIPLENPEKTIPFGLFGTNTNKLEVQHLELRNFVIKSGAGTGLATTISSESAGALIGKASGEIKVEGVVAYNTLKNETGKDNATEIAGTVAGGLIGTMSSGEVKNCAAAVYVNGSNVAGGLIGEMNGGSVTTSYAGGHTINGEFVKFKENEQGRSNVYSKNGSAGGLVGTTYSSSSITNCYSTCSVQGKNAYFIADKFVDDKGEALSKSGNNYGAGWIMKNDDQQFPDLDMNDFSTNMKHPAVYYDDFWKNDYYPYPVISEKDTSQTAWFLIQHVGDWALPGYRGDFINE
ncbi:MAG: prepilin-type N-terminal cleavage/methylation domain-containing protein [Solobacterium sp.]|nr:prepilin-type N-terminal cleavage/methylation domain-containing protein [Solobacterium sp.]